MSGFSNSTNDSARKALRANARTIARKRALKDLLRKVHRTFWHGQLHEAFLRANHAVRARRHAPCADLQHRRASHTMPMRRAAAQAQISPVGSLAQAHLRRPQRTPTTCGRLYASSARRPRHRLVRTTWEGVAAIASRAVAASGTQPLPTGESKTARVAAPRRRRALIRGTRYWQLARPATARRACRSGRHPSQDASVGEGCVRVLESLREAPSRLKF